MNWWWVARLELDAVQGFAVGLVRFSADVIGDAGAGHQVAFIGRIDEHFAAIGLAGLHRDRDDARLGLLGHRWSGPDVGRRRPGPCVRGSDHGRSSRRRAARRSRLRLRWDLVRSP